MDFDGMDVQSTFIQTLARYPALFGGYGNGKTTSLCVKGLNQAYNYPGSTGVIGRDTLEQLKKTTRKEFFRLLGTTAQTARMHPMVAYWNKSDNILVMKNGSEIYFSYLDGDKAIENIQSMNLSWAGVDQAEQCSWSVIEEFDGRIRQKDITGQFDFPHWIALVGNPAGHDAIWKKYFREHQGDPDWPMFVAATMANPHLPPDYVKNLLKNHTAEWVARFVYGSFDTFAGQVYEEWDEKIHVIDPFAVPDNWKVGYGADFGYINPTVFEGGARDWQGHLIVYDEVWGQKTLPGDFCQVLKHPDEARYNEHRIYSKAHGLDLSIWGDPSMMAAAISTGENLQQAYLDNGVFIMPGARTKRIVGINRIKELLKVDYTQPHPYKKGVMGRAGMYVMRCCPHLIEEVPQYRWMPIKPNEEGRKSPLDDVMKVDDHCCDALRYLVMNEETRVTPKPPEPEESYDVGFRRIIEVADRGHWTSH